MKVKTQHETSIMAETDASYRRDLRDLQCRCQRLTSSNEGLKSAADASRVEVCASRKRADAALRELEVQKRAVARLSTTRESLQAAAAADKTTIASLRARLSKGAPNSRLLERARNLKRTAEALQNKSDAQTEALSAKTAELDGSRQEARELAAALDVRAGGLMRTPEGGVAATSDSGTQGSVAAAGELLLELGKARVVYHDLALELARVSEASETVRSEKEELDKRLSLEVTRVTNARAEMGELREVLRRETVALDWHRDEASRENESARKAGELVEALRVREKELLQDLEMARSRCAGLMEENAAMAEAVEQGKAMGGRVDSLQADLDACRVSLSREHGITEEAFAELEAAREDGVRSRQKLNAMEGVERERLRLDTVLKEERELRSTLHEEANASRKKLRVLLAEKDDLVRGLRLAKAFNDQLAKAKEETETREKEERARCRDVRDGKLALQRALLEQLSAARAALREEQDRRLQAEEALNRFSAVAAAATPGTVVPAATVSREPNLALAPLEDSVDSDGEFVALFERGGASGTRSSPPFRPRDTLVQDYLGREGAEQFLSDWDEERSSRSSSLSPSPPRRTRPSSPPPPPSELVGAPFVSLPRTRVPSVDGGEDAAGSVVVEYCRTVLSPELLSPPLPPPPSPPGLPLPRPTGLSSLSYQAPTLDISSSSSPGHSGVVAHDEAIAGIVRRDRRRPAKSEGREDDRTATAAAVTVAATVAYRGETNPPPSPDECVPAVASSSGGDEGVVDGEGTRGGVTLRPEEAGEEGADSALALLATVFHPAAQQEVPVSSSSRFSRGRSACSANPTWDSGGSCPAPVTKEQQQRQQRRRQRVEADETPPQEGSSSSGDKGMKKSGIPTPRCRGGTRGERSGSVCYGNNNNSPVDDDDPPHCSSAAAMVASIIPAPALRSCDDDDDRTSSARKDSGHHNGSSGSGGDGQSSTRVVHSNILEGGLGSGVGGGGGEDSSCSGDGGTTRVSVEDGSGVGEAVVGRGRRSPLPPPPPRSSLLDLADQSIDDI